MYGKIDTCDLIGFVVEDAKTEECSQEYVIQVISVNDEKDYKNTRLLIKQKLGKDRKTNIQYGDMIRIKNGTFEMASTNRNYKGFNYNNYLRTKKIYGIVNVDSSNTYIVHRKKINKIRYGLYQIHKSVKSKIYRFLPQKEASLCTAFFLGDRDEIDDDMRKTFSDASLSHVLALSGMHINYIVLVVSNMFKHCGKRKQKYVVIVFIALYIFFTGCSFSVVRAGIMVIYYMTSYLFNRRPDVFKGICLSSVIIIVCNPYAIYSISFLLSFLATLSIVLFQDRMKMLIFPNIKNKILCFIKESICLSLSANVLLIPVLILAYHKVSFNFIISNIVISIILPIIVSFSIFCIFVSFFSINMAIGFGVVLKWIYSTMISFVQLFSKIKVLTFYTKRPSSIVIVSYYLMCITELLKYKMTERKVVIVIRKLIVILLICFSIISIIFKTMNRNLNIYFVDVGQGDCTVICTPNQKTIIVDGGGSEKGDYVGENTVVPYLLNRRISHVDYMFISHFDSDHVKGLLIVLEELKVSTVIISKQLEDTENYRRFRRIVKNKNIKVITVNKNDRIQIEKDMYIDILWPDKENIIQENVLNNNSIVCRLSYRKFSILFTGDIEEIAEKKIIEYYKDNPGKFKSTVLKVAHHGSNTSSSDGFIEFVNPNIALIGVGENNKFGHPNEEVVHRLIKNRIKVYRTDKNGEICITVNKEGKILGIRKCIN